MAIADVVLLGFGPSGVAYVPTLGFDIGAAVAETVPPVTEIALEFTHTRSATLDFTHTRAASLDFDHERGLALDF